MKERYFLKVPWFKEKTEVSKDEWIKAERMAGFRPKGITSNHPDYMTTCATGGFSVIGGIEGSIEYDNETQT